MLAAGWLRAGVGQPGVLVQRLLGLWRGRGVAAAMISISDTEPERPLSAVTLLSRGAGQVIDQGLAWFCSTGRPPLLAW